MAVASWPNPASPEPAAGGGGWVRAHPEISSPDSTADSHGSDSDCVDMCKSINHKVAFTTNMSRQAARPSIHDLSAIARAVARATDRQTALESLIAELSQV